MTGPSANQKTYDIQDGVARFKAVYKRHAESMGGHMNIYSEDCNADEASLNFIEDIATRDLCDVCLSAVDWLRNLNELERMGFFYSQYFNYGSM